jgi:hypothetical protein
MIRIENAGITLPACASLFDFISMGFLFVLLCRKRHLSWESLNG